MACVLSFQQRGADGCLIPVQASSDESDLKQEQDLTTDCPNIVPRSTHKKVPVFAITSSGQEIDSGLLQSSKSERIKRQATSRHRNTTQSSSPPPRHPEYNNIILRRHTFLYPQHRNTCWPHSRDLQDPENLVRNGFYFTGTGDLTRCFQCGLGLKDWSREDDPLYVHLKYSPTCDYVKNNIDSALIKVYQRHISEANESSTTNQVYASNSTSEVSPKHPEFRKYEVRLSSFSKWSRERRQTPQQLAEAGFFYTGMRDVVRCYACDGGIRSWDSGDEPWIEHARWFPNCPHVRNVKGEDFIRLVQMSAEHVHDDTETNEPTIETMFPLMSRSSLSVIEMGYSRAAVAMAIDECKEKKLKITTDRLLNILLEKQDKGEQLPADTSESVPSTLPQSNGTTKQELIQEQELLKDRLLCTVCKVNECNILFLPCGHHKVCEKCSHNLENCVLCKAKILQTVKTYMS